MGKKKKKKISKARSQAVSAPREPEPSVPVAPDSPEPRARKWIVFAAIAVLVCAGLAFSFRFWQKAAGLANLKPGSFKSYNVLFITIDTLRADHLPTYGYSKVKTPNLDSFAKNSFVFQDAVAHAPLTLPSHTSMMTGKLPIGHGVRDNAGFFVDQKETTLAELLKNHGYATSAFVSAFVLDSRWQMDQGFDLYFDNFNMAEFQNPNPRDVQRRAEETESEVEHWLENQTSKPFFSWVHFYDPHDPYDPPEPFKSEYSGVPYDGEIAYTDMYIGKLLQKLEQLKLQDRTIVIITADHGEGLGEHKEMTHAMFIYNTTQHIPLLIRVPGLSANKIDGIARHIDLAPTLLDLLGIAIPSDMQGKSLIPMMDGAEKSKRLAYSESIYSELHYGWSPLQSITTSEYRYIDAPRPELYDRKQDPDETKNLIQDKPAIAKVLKNELNETLAKSTKKDLAGPQKMDPETEEKLRALGYIGGTAASTEESRKIDPKDKIHLAQGIQEAFTAAEEKHYTTALDKLDPVLREDPTMVDAHFVAGVSYVGLNQLDKGIDELLKTIALKPDHTMALYNIGYAHESKNDLNEAVQWFEKIFQYEKKHQFASLKLAHLYRRMNQMDKAKPYFIQAIQAYDEALQTSKGAKTRSALCSTLGEIYFGAGEMDRAYEYYTEAVSLTPKQKTLHYNLAQIYEAKGDIAKAAESYQKEIEIDPKNYKAFNNLGIIYKKSNRLNDAAFCFQKVVELLPSDPRGYMLLASAYKGLGRVQEANQMLQHVEEMKPEKRY